MEIWRQNGANDWFHLADGPPLFNQFNDSGLRSGVTYWYKVRYRRGFRNGLPDTSAFSNMDDATPGPKIEPYRPIP